MESFHSLVEYFSKFPGIGPRQAKRFAYYLLQRNEEYLRRLSDSILKIKKEIASCTQCRRFYSKNKGKQNLCEICSDNSRDSETLMIVGTDVDLESVEKSGSYHGQYFVLGGLLPIMEKNPETRIRQSDLKKLIDTRSKNGLKEVILALSLNPDGENTMEYLSSELKEKSKETGFKITKLGRGLSTGTELEYSDADTIKNALQGRH